MSEKMQSQHLVIYSLRHYKGAADWELQGCPALVIRSNAFMNILFSRIFLMI